MGNLSECVNVSVTLIWTSLTCLLPTVQIHHTTCLQVLRHLRLPHILRHICSAGPRLAQVSLQPVSRLFPRHSSSSISPPPAGAAGWCGKKNNIWRQLSHQQDLAKAKEAGEQKGRMLKSWWRWKGTMSARDYRSDESKRGGASAAGREIHGHANLLLLQARGVIQHLRGHWFSNSTLSLMLFLATLLCTFGNYIIYVMADVLKSALCPEKPIWHIKSFHFVAVLSVNGLQVRSRTQQDLITCMWPWLVLQCVFVCVCFRTAVLGISFGLTFLLLALILLLCFASHLLVGLLGFTKNTVHTHTHVNPHTNMTFKSLGNASSK